MRAAVVLFVETGENVDAIGAAGLVEAALWQNGIREAGLTATIRGVESHLQVRAVMEAGMAAGNGYLWTEVTSKAFPSPVTQQYLPDF